MSTTLLEAYFNQRDKKNRKEAEDRRQMKTHTPAHPGQILEQYLLGLNPITVAHQLGLTEEELCRVLAGRDPVTPSLAKSLAVRFATDQDMWLLLQEQWDQVQEMRGR